MRSSQVVLTAVLVGPLKCGRPFGCVRSRIGGWLVVFMFVVAPFTEEGARFLLSANRDAVTRVGVMLSLGGGSCRSSVCSSGFGGCSY